MSVNSALVVPFVLVAGAFTAYHSARPAEGRQAPPPDTIYFNAKVVTVDDRFSYAQAVAITGDRFSAVGTNADVRKLAGPQTRQIDLRGLTIIPGLTDNHLHGAGGGPGVDLSRARTINDVLIAVAARVRQSEPADVVVSNSDWHEAQLKEQRLLLRRDLDKVAPMTPVVLVRGGHEYVLNSAALAKWGITKSTPDPPGGRITLSAEPAPGGRVRLSVADTGEGIPPEHLPHVFERFFRVPGKSRGQGTGLGLAIVREVVGAHGGEVACDSAPGQGTTFHLTLPAWAGDGG